MKANAQKINSNSTTPTRQDSKFESADESQNPSHWRDEQDLEHLAVLSAVFKTVQHFFGGFTKLFRNVEDPRVPHRLIYPLQTVMFTGVMLFLCRLGSRRQIGLKLRNCRGGQKFDALFGLNQIPHGDTVNKVCLRIDPDEMQEVITGMTNTLCRSKVLDRYRLFGSFVVAIDATGVVSYRRRHCDNCLVRKQGSKTIYYHNVLEAKIVTFNGLAFSLMTEFIENVDPEVSKQDCELKAFYRLAKRLKKRFGRLPILLSLDGLYARGPPV